MCVCRTGGGGGRVGVCRCGVCVCWGVVSAAQTAPLAHPPTRICVQGAEAPSLPPPPTRGPPSAAKITMAAMHEQLVQMELQNRWVGGRG